MSKHPRPTSWEVFRWPEFIALAKRLGVPLTLPVRTLTLTLHMQELVKISLEQIGGDDQAEQGPGTPPFPNPPGQKQGLPKPWEGLGGADVPTLVDGGVPIETTTMLNETIRTFRPGDNI